MTRILLAGGGHTHLLAAPLLAARAQGASRTAVALLAPSPRLLYSGMMPGWLAGRHRFDDCSIDLARIARGAGIDWVEDTLVDVDFAAGQAVGASGRRHPYDVLSLNVGSANLPGERAPGASVRVLGAKPFADFVAGWEDWLASRPSAPRCVVVGGGAAAVEIAFALASRASRDAAWAGATVTLATIGERLLAGLSPAAGRLARRSLEGRGIAVLVGRRYLGVEEDRVRLEREPHDPMDTGDRRAGASPGAWVHASVDASIEMPRADLVVVATGARPPRWLTDAARRDGLAVGADGGIAVDDCMRSPADDAVFATGDCASFLASRVPKSGVYALRQGAPLAESILASLDGGARGCEGAARYRPQTRSLALLDRGDGTAIGTWGPFAAAGSALWRWKDRIDRGFVARFRQEADPDGVR